MIAVTLWSLLLWAGIALIGCGVVLAIVVWLIPDPKAWVYNPQTHRWERK